MRTGRILIAAALLIGGGAAPARAYVPEETPGRGAEAAARAMLARPAAQRPTAGVVVMRGSRVLWSLGGDRAMVPASLTKLATTYAAMKRFGPDHRFHTRVLAPRAGASPEVLYLVGGGDPTLATERYRRRNFLPQPRDRVKHPAFAGGSPTIEGLARAVRDAGVRSVAGDLIADDSLFDDVRTQQGWLDRYLHDEPDTGLLSALTVDAGYADIERETLLPSPALGAATELRRALARLGVTVAGVRVGAAPRDAVEVARVSSPPVDELIDYINRFSINYPSELLLKSLGASYGGAGSTQSGVSVVRDALAEAGVPVHGLVMTDGSGLSVQNRMSPLLVASLLRAILDDAAPGMDALRASIPVAGAPGTLLRRMTGPPTGGNLRGKTGQIRRVRAMAGWVTAADGVPVVYVGMFNDAPSPFALTGPLDLFGTLLARFPRP